MCPCSWIHKVLQVVYCLVCISQCGDVQVCSPFIRDHCSPWMTDVLLDDGEEGLLASVWNNGHKGAGCTSLNTSKHPVPIYSTTRFVPNFDSLISTILPGPPIVTVSGEQENTLHKHLERSSNQSVATLLTLLLQQQLLLPCFVETKCTSTSEW